MVYFRAMQGGWQPGGPTQYGPPQPQYDPRQPPQGGYDSYGNYEFNQLENSIIGKCAGRAKLLGWISIAAGAFQLLGGGCGAIASPYYAMYVPYGIVSLIVGFTFIGVGNSLQSIVDSRGQDIPHLMQALEKMGGTYLIQAITSIVMIVVGGVVAIFMFFLYLAATAHH